MTELSLMDLNVSVPSEHKASANRYFTDIFSRLPANTQRSYKSDLKSYYQFCFLNDMPGLTPDIDQTEISIKSYVSSMCQSQLAYNTIVHRMATLSKFMSIAKLPDPLKQSEYLRDFIKLEMQDHDIFNRAKQAPALRLEILTEINNNVIPDTLIDVRDLAMINMMFDALLRADELSSVQMKHIQYDKYRLLVPKSKADQSGKGSYRYISNTSLAYISDYINEANLDQKSQMEKHTSDTTRINKGILFRALSPKGTSMLPYDESVTRIRDMKRLDYTSVFRALKRIARKAGVELEISGHSPRVGGAVSMAEAGISTNKIQKAGDWKSAEMPARYTEQANTGSGMEELSKAFER
jgi:site-specific recombinase XerD